jgi:hypothetical protein
MGVFYRINCCLILSVFGNLGAIELLYAIGMEKNIVLVFKITFQIERHVNEYVCVPFPSRVVNESLFKIFSGERISQLV